MIFRCGDKVRIKTLDNCGELIKFKRIRSTEESPNRGLVCVGDVGTLLIPSGSSWWWVEFGDGREANLPKKILEKVKP